MEWIEAKLYTTSEAVEIVTAMLMEAGINGVQIQDDNEMQHFLSTNTDQWDYIDEELLKAPAKEVHVIFFVRDNAVGQEDLLAVKQGIHRIQNLNMDIHLGRLALDLSHTDDEEWLNNWKKYYKPFPVGNKIVIKPTWEEFENNESKIVLQLNPGHVFGTGLHQTTQLCIEQLEKIVDAESTVLDLGCGSGILSIGALLLGAKSALAVDIDPNAIGIAYENATFNNISRSQYTVLSGNILEDGALAKSILNQCYDIVVANIVADIVINFTGFVLSALKPGGTFISSGIIKERLDDVYSALAQWKFQIVGTYEKDGWVCVVCRNE